MLGIRAPLRRDVPWTPAVGSHSQVEREETPPHVRIRLARHDFEVTHQAGTTGRAAVWALSNDLDDVKNWDDDDDEAVSVTLVGAASPTLVLTDHETGASDTSTSLTTQTTYYCTVERTADTTVECRIYSDLGRTTLVDTLSVSVTSGRTWRYLVACNSYNDNEADAISFDVENLRAGDETIDYYYNTSWQVVEERKDGSSDPLAQYVWDIRYIDAPVLRWRDDNLDGDFLDSNETLYYTQDANFNVTALVNPSGTVLERTMYDPYGKPTFYDANWANPSDSSDYANEVLFAGYRYDTETGLYHVRYRCLHPTLGRWMSRDPIGYVGVMNLYQYARSRPARSVDPLGLKEASCGPGKCDGQEDWKDKVNEMIRRLLARAVQGTRSPHAHPGGVWGFLAADAPGKLGMETFVEAELYDLLGTSQVGVLARYGGECPCMLLCGSCVGTDKIGHMFQQGGLLHAVTKDIAKKHERLERAEALSEWTEGLYNTENYDKRTDDWLRALKVTVPGLGYHEERIEERRWGGRWLLLPPYPLDASRPDHVANMAGRRMWEDLEKHWIKSAINQFDICKYVTPGMQEWSDRSVWERQQRVRREAEAEFWNMGP